MSKKEASIVIILKNNNEFLSVSLLEDHSDMNMPGGMVKKNENPIDAGIREVKEETGLDIKNLNFLYKNYDNKTMVYTYYTYDYEGIITTKETHKISWMPLEQLNNSKKWPEYNSICYNLLMTKINN